MRPRVVPLWEVQPEWLLEADAVEGLPVVGAMKSSREAIDHVVSRLVRIGDRETRARLSAEMITWSSLQ